MISLRMFTVTISNLLLPVRTPSDFNINNITSNEHKGAFGLNLSIWYSFCSAKYFLNSTERLPISVLQITCSSTDASYIFSYNSVNNGSAVSYVLNFTYLFSICGCKLSKYPSISIDCDNIISSFRKL